MRSRIKSARAVGDVRLPSGAKRRRKERRKLRENGKRRVRSEEEGEGKTGN